MSTTIDPERRKQMTARVVADVGGAFTVGLAYIGDRLGLFDALARHGPLASEDLAARTGLAERYVREWLKAMVAAEYVELDPGSGLYHLTPEQRAVLADERSPFLAAGAIQLALPSLLHTPALIERFRDGGGIPFGELGAEVARAIDRLHRPWFEHLLTGEWLPAAPEVDALLERGVRALDVGCGLGASTLALAARYPASRFLGIEPDRASLAAARARQQASRLGNVELEGLTLAEVPPEPPFGLVVAIDCIHDMADPVAALAAARELLAPGGLVFWSEPTGSHDPLENRNPLGRMRAALSPYHCLTVSLASGGAGLGTLIGEEGARRLALASGYRSFERLPIASPVQQFFLLRP